VNDYVGKVCPFCKTKFQLGDDIVVCSECDMPHHKECWVENQGCTTFGCLGTIKSSVDAETTVTVVEMDFEDEKNSYSANDYRNYQPYPDANNNLELQQLIGFNEEYYIPKFLQLKNQFKQTSWNWASFWFAPYWMIYRKMYGYGAGFLGAVFVLSLIESIFSSLLLLGGYIAIGIYGDYIYMKFLEGKATQAKAMSEPYKSQYMMQHIGVNTAAAILTMVGFALFMVLCLE